MTKPDHGTSLPDAPAPAAGLILIRIGQTDHPLKMMGQPITRLYPGWKALGFEPSLLSMPVLNLSDESGKKTSWLFDRALNYRASALGDLTPEERDGLIRGATPFFRAMLGQAIAATKPVLAPGALQFMTFSVELRDALIAAWLERQDPPRLIATAIASNEPVHLRDAAATSLAALTQMAMAATGLHEQATPVILSPTGRTILRGSHLPRLDDAEITRFVDPDMGVVFYLGTLDVVGTTGDGQQERKPFLYCPQVGAIVSDLPPEAAGRLPFLLMSYLATDPERFVTTPGEHVVQVGAGRDFAIGAASALAHEAEPVPDAVAHVVAGAIPTAPTGPAAVTTPVHPPAPGASTPFVNPARDLLASAQIGDAFHGRFAESQTDDPSEAPRSDDPANTG